MKWQNLGETPCSIARSLAIVGDRWTILILRNAFLRTRRFDDFQQQLSITRHLLASRLAKLVKLGVLAKVPYQEKPPRYEYLLTEMGRDWYSVQLALVAWGDKWLAGTEGPPVEYVHRNCGKKFTPTVSCSECGETINPREITPIANRMRLPSDISLTVDAKTK
ncbi:winged helix-turn-helix transcriptional regulator [Stenotrophobium rhamnosiphilum]|uniref:Transcriptional regulator n=1 Tax=Stenotrophobium rhamnosiphilum TaxID=2029166 RepID=A0A2T5ME55_9GAMM|nr:helix-turn-helix domain-containing protein [Stenotrophobium rhamnosiphilum]PTU30874.1 transcriptional regulator [Stenotrophobium rhamnosiphilum]